MSRYVLAIDQGTTTTRCMIFDHKGAVASMAHREHRQIYPKPGWVEHDPMEIWELTQAVVSEAMGLAKMKRRDLAAIGIANQRETSVVWERDTGRPIYPAIVWQDTRTDDICRSLSEDGGQNRFQARTGLPVATYFSGPKIAWILQNVSGARLRAKRGELLFGTVDTWLIWNLTGAHITDVTNASRTMLLDLHRLDWDEELLRLLDIPRVMLPEVKSSAEIYGLARGALGGVPVAGDLGDQQASLFGQACFSPGEAKNTYGTGCFMLLNTGEKPVLSRNGLLTTVAYKIGDQPAVYALEGSIAIAGALVDWLRENLGLIEESSQVEDLARTVEDNGGIYFVPAFSGLFAPHWRSEARGVLVGLTRYINRGHIARAALEATAYQTREVLEAMEKDSGVKLTALKTDGKMVANELLMQFQADILNVPIIRPKVTETTALGAAYAAGLAVGFWGTQEHLRLNWGEDKRWTPGMDPRTREKLYAGWKKAVTRALDWV